MIIEYHRPETMDEALELLGRTTPKTVPLGGGTVLNAPSDERVAVVDLQALGLDKAEKQGSTLKLGAAARLQAILDLPGLPEALAKAVRHEAAYNLRQMATAAGTLAAADGRSPFAAVMLALDAQLSLMPGEEKAALGEVMPLRGESLKGRLITEVQASLNPDLAYEYAARSPADLPVIGAAVARWGSGRTRVVLCGFGSAPVMVVDGKDENDITPAVENALMNAGDEWASAEYRMEAGAALVKRCLDAVKG